MNKSVGFIPKPHCNVGSGDCFTFSRCLGNCSAERKKDHESRIKALERNLLALERVVYALKVKEDTP